MDKQDILRMAREAAAQHGHTIKPTDEIVETLTSFASLATAAAVEQERKEFAVHAIDIARKAIEERDKFWQNHMEPQIEIEVNEAILEEREACAKVCEEYETENDITATWLNIVAEAIRARGEMK
jgi:hypothetical protein